MINLASVIHSPMLSQDVLVKRTSGVWINGEFVADGGIVCPTPLEMKWDEGKESAYRIYRTPSPTDNWDKEDVIHTRYSDAEVKHMQGIITVASPRDLNMIPEADRQSGAIKVLTTERLQVTGDGEGQANFSDIILWRGEEYRVYSVSPDADYGFYRSIAMRMLRGSS